MAERGVEIPLAPIDLMKREHKAAEYRALNPLGQVPTLVLDDGTAISETVAICRYLDETAPGDSLFGTDPRSRAIVDMWIRRVEFVLMQPVGGFWRHAHPRTAALLTQYKDYGESNRETFVGAARFFDKELEDRPFIAGPGFTMADICAITTLDFAALIGLSLPESFEHLARWRTLVSGRPSMKA
jgi:glutathione S-transferase